MIMKTKHLLPAMFAVFAAFATSSCTTNDDYSEWDDGSKEQKVTFRSVVKELKTRATDSQWADGDQVGVFMTKANEAVATTNSAVKYIAKEDGQLTPADENQSHFYPKDGSAVDFVAYYPYKDGLTNNVYKVDVSDQTNQPAIDLLYSDNVKAATKETQKPVLVFTHKLSGVKLEVSKDGTIPSLDGLKVTIKGVKTTADFNLASGEFSAQDGVKDVALKVDGNIATAILIPEQALADVKVAFELNGKTFEASYPQSELKSGSMHKNKVLISEKNGRIYVEFGNSAITDWEEVAGDDINVQFGNGETPTPPTPPNPPTPPTGDVVVIFDETFGAGEKKNKNNNFTVEEYKGYTDTHNYTHTDVAKQPGQKYSHADVRKTPQLDGHAFLPAGTPKYPNKNASYRISGFKTTDLKELKLSYDIAANSANVDQNIITVTVDGDVKLDIPSAVITTSNKYQRVEVALPDNITYIQFNSIMETNKVGFRIDNVKIEGKRK